MTETITINKLNKLEKAVIKQLQCEPDEIVGTLQDIANHGVGGGFCGFTYYSDTVEFYKANRSDIVHLLEELADDLGEDVISMVKGFSCLKDMDIATSEVGWTLWGNIPDGDSVSNCDLIANALAWFAAEEVANKIINEQES